MCLGVKLSFKRVCISPCEGHAKTAPYFLFFFRAIDVNFALYAGQLFACRILYRDPASVLTLNTSRQLLRDIDEAIPRREWRELFLLFCIRPFPVRRDKTRSRTNRRHRTTQLTK